MSFTPSSSDTAQPVLRQGLTSDERDAIAAATIGRGNARAWAFIYEKLQEAGVRGSGLGAEARVVWNTRKRLLAEARAAKRPDGG